ncbi:enoyl-CoA hydratase-related protein [Gordonia sp. (in: high G+C Gram-positive bacteria)]|uniref:enoyl-CoA hydratase/isomerase family protein n=1 Tax=Gordonia sp. (in: high G+C Gram-positive bacteria) TaxID=84139 RepID=UPI0016BA7429|nr:enoyl-CoA hydratase-related protein [Gordonia sp. (in: high G+C Gram-positive bacteria)]NLG47535.1 enoyl-CoA hydratase [Gordonia sp. (in: high G+C Gram-positive bacteria)]
MISELDCVDGVWGSVDDDGIARLEIDRPKQMNALDGPASARVMALCTEWAARDDVRVVILSGRGGSFSTGADVAGMATSSASAGGFGVDASRAIIENGSNLVRAIRGLPMPVVAALDGPAVGIGASMAVAADLIYATSRSYFLLAFVNIGLMPDGGATSIFTAAVGRARANAMALLGEKLSAADAYDAGLINAYVDDPAGLGAVVDRVAKRLARSSSQALALTKKALDEHSLQGFETSLDREIAGQTELLQSPQFQAALAAFANR